MRWIKHQTLAHTDAKLKKLIVRQGMAAYGLYWYCLELIGKNVCESRLTFEIEEDAELLAHATGMTREQVEGAMRTMVELGLFENIEGRISCLTMIRHIDSSMFKAGSVRERFVAEKDKIMAEIGQSTSTVHVPSMYGTCKTGQDRTGQDMTGKEDSGASPHLLPPTGDSPRADPVPYKQIQALWNEIAVSAGLPACKVLSKGRKAAMRQRHNGEIIEREMENWADYFKAITKSAFMCGKNDRGWRADIDFALSERGMTRTFEGKYHKTAGD
jgi:hypothetical protein